MKDTRNALDLRLTASITAFVAQSFLVRGHEVSMPKNEVTDPVYVWRLTIMDRLMVVETVQCIRDSRNGVLLRQTQYSVNMRLLLRPRKLTPMFAVG